MRMRFALPPPQLTDQEANAALVSIVHSTAWLCEVLHIVREVGPPGAFVAAGAVRDTVWDCLTGRVSSGPYADVDVVYFDNAEPARAPGCHERSLRAAKPSIEWEVTNQATVHRWHWQTRGALVVPHQSLDEAVATWPETATAVGVRLATHGTVDVLAPLGLADLFGLCLRRNPVQTAEVFWSRVAEKCWTQRWPELELVAA
jgi:hypothetical protein